MLLMEKYIVNVNIMILLIMIFRNVIQEHIDKQVLKFPEKNKETMAIDTTPFPINVSTNMIGITMKKRSDPPEEDLRRTSSPASRLRPKENGQ